MACRQVEFDVHISIQQHAAPVPHSPLRQDAGALHNSLRYNAGVLTNHMPEEIYWLSVSLLFLVSCWLEYPGTCSGFAWSGSMQKPVVLASASRRQDTVIQRPCSFIYAVLGLAFENNGKLVAHFLVLCLWDFSSDGSGK